MARRAEHGSQSARLDSAPTSASSGCRQDAAELEQELQSELDGIDAAWTTKAADVQVAVRLEKADVARRPGRPRLDPDELSRLDP